MCVFYQIALRAYSFARHPGPSSIRTCLFDQVVPEFYPFKNLRHFDLSNCLMGQERHILDSSAHKPLCFYEKANACHVNPPFSIAIPLLWLWPRLRQVGERNEVTGNHLCIYCINIILEIII
jgi:hypothetical protein